jgi:hypothetical protein
MSEALRIVEAHLDALARQSEAWKEDHDKAMACYRLEEVIAYAIFVFDRIVAHDNHWHSEIFNKNAAYNDDLDREIETLFRLWSAQALICLDCAKTMSQQGFRVDGADRLQSQQEEALGILTPDEEFFNSDNLVKLRDSSIDDYRRGDTTEVRSWRE